MEKMKETYLRIAAAFGFAAVVVSLLVILDVTSKRYDLIPLDGFALIMFLALFLFAFVRSREQKPS